MWLKTTPPAKHFVYLGQFKSVCNSLPQNSDLADLEPNAQIRGGVTKRIWDYIRTNN